MRPWAAQLPVRPRSDDESDTSVRYPNLSRILHDNIDNIAAGANINGLTIAGVKFLPSSQGAPLIVVRGDTTWTATNFTAAPYLATNKLYPTSGNNVLSPGGAKLGPGVNNANENDDLTLEFVNPISAFGFDHLSQSADGVSSTSVQVFNTSGQRIYSGNVPISNFGNGGQGRSDFWGIIATNSEQIKKIVINEYNQDRDKPDSNVGFDTFRTKP